MFRSCPRSVNRSFYEHLGPDRRLFEESRMFTGEFAQENGPGQDERNAAG